VLFSASWLLEEPGRKPGLVGVAQDISEWKSAQDKLRRMSKVFMDATDPIVVLGANGLIVEANSEAERSYGWSSAELRGRHLSILFPGGRHTEVDALLDRCLGGEAIRNSESVQVDRSGGEFSALVTLSLLTGEDGTTAGIAAISKDITDRKRAEEALRVKQAELQALTSRLMTAQEEERSRLARELHDDLTQRLAAVAIAAGKLERMPPESDEDWRAAFGRIKKEMANLSDQVHGLSRRLHPSTLDELGLVAAIESECRAFFERGGPPVDFRATGDLPDLPGETRLALYRIVQESLRNILKHAAADEVTISLRASPGEVALEIHDNGHGFDPSLRRNGGGIGMTSMQERARLAGATLAVESKPGGGTTIKVALSHEEAHNTAGR
jgi:PAS domain S-box-containing protein